MTKTPMNKLKPIAATAVEENPFLSLYPEPFAALMQGRTKRKLGEHFDLTNFGVNLTELAPGAISALKHYHLTQDEFIYILSGTPTLVIGTEEYLLKPGECCGFKKANNVAHQLINRSKSPVLYLEIGDRMPADQVNYPDDDLRAELTEEGTWEFLHKDGREY